MKELLIGFWAFLGPAYFIHSIGIPGTDPIAHFAYFSWVCFASGPFCWILWIVGLPFVIAVKIGS